MTDRIEHRNSAADWLRALRKRRDLLLIVFAAGALVTIALTLLLPAMYKSSATILIEQQELPADFVRSTVTSYADQRVQVISQRVMTTQTLLDLIKRFDLYPRQRTRESREELMARMRDDIDFRMISADVIDPRSGRPTAATIAFSVSYTSPVPETAARVANALSSLYLNENLTQRARLAEDAASFLRGQGDMLDKRIGQLEAELAAFKQEHAGSLPEYTQLNLQLLDRAEQQMRDAETRQMALDQQRLYLEAQLAQLSPVSSMYAESGERILSTNDRLKTLKSQLASAEARYSPDHPDIARLRREIAGLNASATSVKDAGSNDLRRQLEDARTSLAAAEQKYTPDHPDRVRLAREVSALEARLATQTTAAVAPSQTEALKPDADADNPAYIQIQAQLSSVRNDQAALVSQVTQMRNEVANYRRMITVSPQIEKQYRELSRDYDDARAKYHDIRAKQMEAQTAQNLETDRKGERFTLIEPPLTPEKPVSPNRGALLVVGLLLSLAFAAALLWLFDSNDRRVRGRADLARLLGAPPLAVVPRIGTERDRRDARRRWRLTLAGSTAMSVLLLLTVAHVFVRPLDVLWAAVLRKLGV
jgi:protein tyrosine kinase modulator